MDEQLRIQVEQTRAKGIELSNAIEEILLSFERMIDDVTADDEPIDDDRDARPAFDVEESTAVRELFDDIDRRIRQYVNRTSEQVGAVRAARVRD